MKRDVSNKSIFKAENRFQSLHSIQHLGFTHWGYSSAVERLLRM